MAEPDTPDNERREQRESLEDVEERMHGLITSDPFPSWERRRARKIANEDKRWAHLWPRRKKR